MKLPVKLAHKFYILIGVPLAFELVFVAVLVAHLNQLEVEARHFKKSSDIATTAEELYQKPTELQKCISHYIQTRDIGYFQKYKLFLQETRDKVKLLKTLTADDKGQLEHVMSIEKAADKTDAVLREFFQSVSNEAPAVAAVRLQQISLEFFPVVQEAQVSVLNVIKREKDIQKQFPENEDKIRSQMKTWLAAGVFFNILLAVVLALFFQRGTLRRLSVVMDNTDRLAAGRDLMPLISGSDEIAALDKVFHETARILKDSSRKERAVVENAKDVICSLDAEARFTKVSPASLDLWGYSREELINTYVIELVYPEDIASTAEMLSSLIGKESERPFEIRMRKKDGSLIYTLWSAHWSEFDHALFCVVHDITERKLLEEAIRANEARVRFILENMPVGLVVLSKEGVIDIVNPAMEQIFGYSAEELIGKRLVSLFPPGELDPQAATEDLYQKAIGHIYEREAVRKNGTAFPIHISITEFEFLEGRRFLGIILDVTERHEIERFKQEFLGVVSHELRTPLTSIRGSMKLMLVGALGPLSEQAQKALTIAERSATRLIGLVNDLLDMEKLEAGKMEMHFESIPIGPVVETSVESVKAFAEQHEVSIDVQNPGGTVFGDGDRLVQVLVNLLSNAIKYSPKGATATVAVVQHPDEIEVRVSDKGRGIPKTHINSLFQKFKQVERTDATKKGGTGLGLVICKAIIEQHLGTIGVESELGEGSTFWFRVPSSQRAPSEASKPMVYETGKPSAAADDKKSVGISAEIV
ncbi:MAG TPA: PAS domain S-box protein [Candidatus Obscuribacterales bacterium]